MNADFQSIESELQKRRVAARTEFAIEAAPHVGNREMVRCVRYEDGKAIAESWVEPHRIQSHSPTGPLKIIEALKAKSEAITLRAI